VVHFTLIKYLFFVLPLFLTYLYGLKTKFLSFYGLSSIFDT